MKMEPADNGIKLVLTFAECDALYRLILNNEDLPKSFCLDGTTDSFKKSILANQTKLKNNLINGLDSFMQS